MVNYMTIEQALINPIDKLKWFLVFLLLAGGIVANYFFEDVNFSIRLIGWILLMVAVLAIGANTRQGQRIVAFSKESRSELRRVVWPTRQETIRTTIMVVVLILIVGFVLWGIDSVLFWAVSLVTK
jgi:preprotein translocase subunit SecE